MRPCTRRFAAAIAALSISATASAAQDGFVVPAWAYPGNQPPAAAAAPSADPTLLHVPNSHATFTHAQVKDLFAPPDWHPDSHPPMPEIVAHGRKPAVYACGYCHLPDGQGRPENAALAGLPAAYIVAQVADFRSGERRSALLGPHVPTDLMRATAENATDEEIAAAAEYFSGLRMSRRVEVIESTVVPKTRELGWLYVPIGSIARGRNLAEDGNGVVTVACVSCHGPDLRGAGLVPALAGRSPSYIVRQLLTFKTGARATPASQPMRPVVARLEVEDMIAVAAFAAAKEP